MVKVVLLKEELRKVFYETVFECLELAMKTRYENAELLLSERDYFEALPNRKPELIRLALFYLKDRGFIDNSLKITADGIDFLLEVDP